MDFDALFSALTDNCPFPWQRHLYREFVKGRFPLSCNLPTGLGKTAVIPIWLIALASAAAQVPRRLVYVVNRRTVVDQATEEARKIRDRLLANDRPAALSGLVQVLGGMASTSEDSPLAISTLRGQFADNREWSADPCRPAVIVGTVDMIGSRLLFSGYGIGFKSKPLHAGFLGQDTLLVHDEAHLEPAFQELLNAIQKEQIRSGDIRSFRVMELSATSRGQGEVLELSKQDYADKEVKKRIDAKKLLCLHENTDENKLADRIAEKALEFKDSKRAVMVFVRKVDDAAKIAKKLPKGQLRQLTGTLRGLERDMLVDDPIFRRFLPKSDAVDETVFLVCTSAGEVGVNISADHLVSDLSTFESMAQRFGRVNRFGERNDTEVHVLYPQRFDENEEGRRRQRTRELLSLLEGDASPRALGELDPNDRLAAFAAPPEILSVSDILFDAWALTTIRDRLPGRPSVEPYLHGRSSDPPETHVGWRKEVELITEDLLAEYKPEELLADYPLKPHELLRDNTNRVFDRLKKLKADRNTPIWIVSQGCNCRSRRRFLVFLSETDRFLAINGARRS
jgi:CRISPR-associated endonuclease/helicase Cas3